MQRPEKLSHRDTIVYEIDMLEFCCQKLVDKQRPLSNCEGYAFLECFLLHYRNLIEFFGKSPEQLRRDDLSVFRPSDWAPNSRATEDQIKPLVANSLYQQYEGLDDEGNKRLDTISRYLQHCTRQRIEAKDWPIDEMYNAIRPLIEKFRGLVGPCEPVAVDRPCFVVGQAGASTMTVRSVQVSGSDSE